MREANFIPLFTFSLLLLFLRSQRAYSPRIVKANLTHNIWGLFLRIFALSAMQLYFFFF